MSRASHSLDLAAGDRRRSTYLSFGRVNKCQELSFRATSHTISMWRLAEYLFTLVSAREHNGANYGRLQIDVKSTRDSFDRQALSVINLT